MLRKQLKHIYYDFLNDHADEETWVLAFSLLLELLPNNILNSYVNKKHFGYVDYYSYWLNKDLTVKDILQLGLKHKEIEPIKKHTYSFIWGTKLTVDSILYDIIFK